MLEPLQLVDAPRELALARPGRPHQQHRRTRSPGNLLDLVDHAVKGGVARLDPRFEERRALGTGGGEARGDTVVARQIEIDHRPGADPFIAAAPRLGLEQAAGQIMGLGQQEPADLRDMGAGGDVDQIILGLRIERKGTREIEQLAVDLLEIPRIVELDQMRLDRRLGRDRSDILGHISGEPRMHLSMKQHQPIDPQILVHRQADGRPPLVPARRPELARIERRAEEADHDGGSHPYNLG